MKVKLQPASATDLPAHNPILPPAAITQVMLIAHRPQVRLCCLPAPLIYVCRHKCRKIMDVFHVILELLEVVGALFADQGIFINIMSLAPVNPELQ